MLNPPDSLPLYLARIHRELGIPPAYASGRRLHLQIEAQETELVDAGTNPDGRPVLLTPTTAKAWSGMQSAARQQGVVLIAISGFRSVERQIAIIRGKLAAGQPIEDILGVIAAPGFSEHHTGCALDIGSPGELDLEETFAETSAFRWLESHARDFGFHLSFPRNNPHGIAFEPWHWLQRR